ncbi:unnamed protein product [Rotaria sp. Silwood1]|nr:unnamed protein product [Rotaria sp. Silwood1]CAF5145625.1 unnamed protein product [Rotaria sp. Silwood1]
MANNEDFMIVWLDENQDKTAEYFATRQSLNYVIQYVRTFNDTDKCIDFITSQQMINIFFSCIGNICSFEDDSFQNYSKVAGVFIDRKRLVSKLVVDIAKHTHNTISISLLEKDLIKSIRDLIKEHASLIWFQLLIEILLRMDEMDIAKNEIIHECFSQYTDDIAEQTKIGDFQNNYNETKAVW